MELGKAIKQIRQERGLTQTDLAKKIGTTKACISRYETGKRMVSLNAFLGIAEALGVSGSDLYKYGYQESKSTHIEPHVSVFGSRLLELRGDRTLTDFARVLGISRQSLGFYINGSRIPDIHTLRKICEACGCSSDYIIGLSNIKNPDTDIFNKALQVKRKLYEALQEFKDL